MKIFLFLFISLNISSIAYASRSSLPEIEETQKRLSSIEVLHKIILRERAREENPRPVASALTLYNDELYEKGLTYRADKKYEEAKECFYPLAEKKSAFAEHCLGVCHFHLGEEWEAYDWLKKASDQGFTPADAMIKKVNLLYVLLPDEVLIHIASFLSMKDLQAFKTVSSRAHRVYQSLITSTNFLTSDHPYAQDFRSIFSKVTFEPQPQAIRILVEAKSSEGDIEVHFRDTKHLKKIVDQTPEIKPERNLYFVRDEAAQDGEELVPTSGIIEKSYFVHVISDKPLKLTGHLYLSCGIVLPLNTQWAGCNVKLKFANQGSLKAYKKAHALATELDTFDDQLLQLRTKEAHALMEKQKAFRKRFPYLFPSLSELCPESLMVYDKNLEVVQKDYITAKEPLIYRAPSITALEELRTTLPELKEAIAYINPNHDNVGVYCSGPLSVGKGFEINAEGDIILWGKFILKDYSFSMIAEGTSWFLGPTIRTSGSICITSGNVRARTDDLSTKDPEMPDHLWRALLRALGYVRLGYLGLGDVIYY